jgi:hypothetical protein
MFLGSKFSAGCPSGRSHWVIAAPCRYNSKLRALEREEVQKNEE